VFRITQLQTRQIRKIHPIDAAISYIIFIIHIIDLGILGVELLYIKFHNNAAALIMDGQTILRIRSFTFQFPSEDWETSH
jgi:hypothetical protein